MERRQEKIVKKGRDTLQENSRREQARIEEKGKLNRTKERVRLQENRRKQARIEEKRTLNRTKGRDTLQENSRREQARIEQCNTREH